MANINIKQGNVTAEGGSQQIAGEPFQIFFTVNNRATIGGVLNEAQCDTGGPIEGHRGRVVIEINGNANDGTVVDRRVNLGENCFPLEEGDDIEYSPSITIQKPGNYSIRVIVTPLPEGVNRPDSETISVNVKKPGTVGNPAPGGGGGGSGGGNNNRPNGGGNLLQTAINRPVASLVVLGGLGVALQSAFGGEG